MSGWIALTFLNDPNIALIHFKNFYDNVGYPISLARGAYWLGHTYKTKKNNQKSKEWFTEASKYLNTYYGQLAFIEVNPGKEFSLGESVKISDKFKKEFYKDPLVKPIKFLHELDKTKHTKDLLKHLSLLNISKGKRTGFPDAFTEPRTKSILVINSLFL